jgi:biotin carboxyl carrier protein
MTQELTVHSSKGKSHKVQFEDATFKKGIIDDQSFEWQVESIDTKSFHAIKDNKSYRIEVLHADSKTKAYTIKVNGKKIDLTIEDQFDKLLHKLGLDNFEKAKISEMKAPMPGLVLSINVAIGDTVAANDAIMVLEAMKMENVLKSPTEGVIKSIEVEKGIAVEKNQVLITFE